MKKNILFIIYLIIWVFVFLFFFRDLTIYDRVILYIFLIIPLGYSIFIHRPKF